MNVRPNELMIAYGKTHIIDYNLEESIAKLLRKFDYHLNTCETKIVEEIRILRFQYKEK